MAQEERRIIKGFGMKNKIQILDLYNFYKNKLNEYEDRDENDIGYISEKEEVKDILKLLENILEL